MTTLARRMAAATVGLALLAGGCAHVEETRVSPAHADYEAAHVQTHVEHRTGRKVGTWKPYVASALILALVGASGMIVYGFYQPQYRSVAVTGIVITAALPVVGAIPFVVDQKTPWVRYEWHEWRPANGVDAQIDVIGRHDKPLATTRASTDAHGKLDLPLDATLCPAPAWKDLGIVDVVIRVPDADPRSVSIATDRLGEKLYCSGRLSLLHDRPEASG